MSATALRVLLVHGDLPHGRELARELDRLPTGMLDVSVVDSAADALPLNVPGVDALLVAVDPGAEAEAEAARLAALTAAAAPVPVIAVLARADGAAEAAAEAAGAAGCIIAAEVRGSMLRRAIAEPIRRQRLESALEQSRERLRLASRATNAILWEHDLRTDRIECREHAPDSLGYAASELPTSVAGWLELMHEDDHEHFIRTFSDALGSGEDRFDLEYRLRRQDGSWAFVHCCAWIVRDAAGAPIRLVGATSDITEQRLAETALRRSEARLRLITDTIQTIFYVADARPLRMTYVSPAFEAIWGIPKHCIYDPDTGRIGNDVLERFLATIHPDDRARTQETIARRVRGEEVYWEYRIVRADGAVRWIGDRSYPLRGPTGEIEQIVGFAEDITRQVESAIQLRRNEERLARVLETMAEGVMIFDAAGRITFANRASEAIAGFPRGEMIGRSVLEPRWRIVDDQGEPIDPLRLPIALVLAKGTAVYGSECTYVRPDGAHVVLSINAAPLTGPDGGAPESIIASIRDVTRDKVVAGRLKFQASLLGAVGEAVTATDLAGRITYWNRQAERCTGWTAEEVVGRYILDVIAPPEGRDGLVEILVQVAQNRRYAGEHLVLRRDGTTYPAVITGTPIQDDSGAVIGLVATSMDVTDMKRLEEQLHQAQRMEAVGRLAGGVAHDFNNILTGIKGYTHFVLEELGEAHALRGDAEEIAKAADRAAGLTRQLLAFSRKQVLQPRVLDLASVVRRMENMLIRLIGEDVELVCTYEPELGRVLADPGQIEQVLLNLAVNARDAMPAGGRLHIQLSNEVVAEQPARGWVVLRVSDTGVGIPAAALPYVFEPFFTTKSMGDGTGLGLSTVYGIVTQSGGSIEVESAEGRGTVFEIRLPRAAGPVEAAAGIAITPRPARGETILLVEDEESVRTLAARTLRRVGYVVLEAASGSEALRLCEHHDGPIDLLLTDVVMPRMSGREVAERLAECRRGTTVLFMSGYTADVIARHGILEEGQLFLEKPFTPLTLASRVREVLDARPQAV